ncbi:MAG: hypothetical protein BWZ02_01728 [Lentisphaerae bacterium ADurb.BinA184]|nr:MAG: hypothetical protein BWZ02_01728 [Lentisphaerae bacterium ADurb.BinA184]
MFIIANTIVPFLMMRVPALGLLFVPIVLVEAAVVHYALRQPWRTALRLSLMANLWTSLIGAVLVLPETLLEVMSANLWDLVSIVAFFALTCYFEKRYYARRCLDQSPRRVLWATLLANVLTYVPLTALMFLFSGRQHQSRMERVYQIACSANLHSIGQALELYALDCAGQYPPANDLGALVRANLLTDDSLHCPGRNWRRPGRDREKPGPVDYVYLGAPAAGAPATTPIVWDHRDNHPDFGNVLFANLAAVRGVQGEEWHAFLRTGRLGGPVQSEEGQAEQAPTGH